MTGIEVATKVAAEHQAVLFRPRKGEPGRYDVKELFSGGKRGWVILDGFSAAAVVAVHKGLNEVNRARFEALELAQMVKVAFRLVK